MGRIISAIILGVIFLDEKMGVFQFLGIALVLGGITLVNFKSKQGGGEKVNKTIILLVATSGLLNSVSSVMDKWIMSDDPNRFLFGSETIETPQLQFWYMLYLLCFY